jgi:glycosyltransferase involved in cell wall biosynthesis
LYEGVSLALLEAMAAGLPAVVTRVGGNPEVVMDGECGFLIESGDTEGFARALVTLAREGDLRVRMGRAARARIEAEFDLKKAVKQYEEIYLRSVRRAGD